MLAYGKSSSELRIGPESFSHTLPVSSMRRIVLNAALIDAQHRLKVAEVIEHDRRRQREQPIRDLDDVAAGERLELAVPAGLVNERGDAAG